jgi:hypothetical protein
MKPRTILPCVIGVLVLIIGAIVIIKIIRWCQKYLGDPLPNPPQATNGPIDTAAYFPLQPQSASQPAVLNASTAAGPCDCGCSISLSAVIAGGQLILTNTLIPKSESAAEFGQQLAALGINEFVPKAADGITEQNGAVVVTGDSPVTIIIERSFDLLSWQAICNNTIPAGRTLQMSLDGPCSNVWYRGVLW